MSQQLVLDDTSDAKNLARILYIAHGITFFFSLGMLSILPVIVNHVKRPDTAGSLVHSHHTWMIRTFWYYLAWMALGWVLFATLIGLPLAFLIWGAAWVWHAYRLIRGFIDLNNNKAEYA